MSSSRSVRVFLSSTFRDFGEERDLLVRKVFPGLRAKLKDRFVELVDVDLRWGITAEEAERGEVLPICLAEIDRARPYFVGMLGDRYGWIPESNKYLTDLLERQPWLEEHRGGKSVTELEILHGVLNDPQMAGRAFFYFRSPDYAKAKGGDYVAASAEDASRQAHLKDRIRKSGFPVVEDYSSPEAFAERLENDLWQVLDETFPADEVPDGFERESRKHEAYALPRKRLYLGGERYASALTDYLDGKQQRVLIEGQSGGGKSALLANWIEAYRKTHPDLVVHEHYLAASADAADPASLVRRLIEQIKRVTGSSEEIPGDPQKLYESLSLWLANASAWGAKEGQDWIFVIDALNTLTDLHDLRFFPEFLPEHVHFVISCLPGEVHEALLAKGEWARLVVEPLDLEESRTLLREYLKRYNKTLPPELEAKALSHPLATNPLFLRTLAEELRLFGRHEDLANRLNLYLTSKTIDDLFERVLERVEGDCGEEAVQKTLTAIWASRSGLSEKEIMGIANLKPLEWAPIRFALDDMLLDINGRLSFAHDYMKIAISDRYLHGNNSLQNEGQSEDALNARRALHASLAQWFEDQFKANTKAKEEAASKAAAQNNLNLKADDTIDASDNDKNSVVTVDKGADTDTDALNSDTEPKTLYDHEAVHEAWVTDERAAEEVPYQWQQAEDWQRLKDCLTTRTMFEAVYNNRGEQELLAYWLDLENNMEANIERGYETAWRRWNPDETQEQTGNLASRLQSFLSFAGRYKDFTEKLARLALSIAEKIFGIKNRITIERINRLAILSEQCGDFINSEILFLSAISSGEQLGDDLSVIYYKNNLSNLLVRVGKYDQAFEVLSTMSPNESALSINKINLLSMVECGRGRYNNAIELSIKSKDLSQKYFGKSSPLYVSALYNLAQIYLKAGVFSDSFKYCEENLNLSRSLFGNKHPYTADAIANLAWILTENGDFKKATQLYEEAHNIYILALGESHPTTGLFLVGYGVGPSLYSENYSESITILKKAYSILSPYEGLYNEGMKDCCVGLGQAYFLGKSSLELSEFYFRQAHQFAEKIYGVADSNVFKIIKQINIVLKKLNRNPDFKLLISRGDFLSIINSAKLILEELGSDLLTPAIVLAGALKAVESDKIWGAEIGNSLPHDLKKRYQSNFELNSIILAEPTKLLIKKKPISDELKNILNSNVRSGLKAFIDDLIDCVF